uniref:Uncharacterized protein n=1 Tax=Propithecus coquereli TaxID=379532 RepID=A0A2K6FHU7_PROCO
MLPRNKDQPDMALASVQGHRVPWGVGRVRGKREGPCGVQGPGGPGPGPGGPCGAPPNRTRPAATAFAAPVARHNRPGPVRGVSCMPGVPPAPQPLLPHPQVQDWTPAACLPPTTALWAGPGIQATPHRHWLRPLPASGPGQGLASVARKKARGSRASGGGCSGPWVSIEDISGSSSSRSSGSGPGRSNPRHTLPDREPPVCRSSITKFHQMFQASTSGTKTGHCLSEAQTFPCPKEAYLSRAHSPKVAILVPEPRRLPGAPPPNPALPIKLQISGSPRDTLKGWLTGGQVCSPALNPGSPLWSLLSPG